MWKKFCIGFSIDLDSELTCTEPCRSAGVRLPRVAPGLGTSGHAATPPLAFVCGRRSGEIAEFVSYRFGSVRFGLDRIGSVGDSYFGVSGCFMGLSERSMHKFVSYLFSILIVSYQKRQRLGAKYCV